MKYYITWAVDGPAILTVVDSGELELTIDQLMEAAFHIEEMEVGLPYDIYSIIKADTAEVIH